MSTRVTTTSRMTLEAVLQPSAPFSGSTTLDVSIDHQMGHGTGDFQADRAYRVEMTVDDTGTEVDLQTATDKYGTAIALAEVVALSIYASEDNAETVIVSGGALNAWEVLFADAGQGLVLQPGQRIQVETPLNGSLPVSSTSKTLLFAAESSSYTGDVTFMVVGRSQ